MPASQGNGTKTMADAADSKRKRKRRRASDLSKLPRSSALSHFYWAKEDAAPPNYPPVAFYTPAALSGWLRNYLAYVFRKKHDFPSYTASPQNALYDLVDENGAERIRIALAGDWGTGTDEAQGVANQMENFKPHFTIHLGDVYYVGDSPEVKENCLGIRNPSNNYDPVLWPIGSRGSFAMNGNHEMYANGVGYFEVLIPELGLWVDGKMTGQQTSFFYLSNRHWCIIALDTGYNSIGLPILGQIPTLNRVPGVGGDAALRPELLEWLAKFVLPLTDKRGIIHSSLSSSVLLRLREPLSEACPAAMGSGNPTASVVVLGARASSGWLRPVWGRSVAGVRALHRPRRHATIAWLPYQTAGSKIL